MIYLLGMPARVVIGTSLVMILAVSAATTMVHSLTTRAVDIVLAGLLLVGGVIGAQYGAMLTIRIKPDLLRLALAVIILHRRAAHGARPRLAPRRDLLDRISVKRRLASSCCCLLAPLLIARRQAGAGARHFRAAGADPLQLHRRAAAAVRRGRLSRRTAADQPGRHRRRAARTGPADPGAREAEDRRHLDECGFRTASARRLPSTRSLRRGRSRDLVDERTAAIYELGLHNLQLSPGGGALPEKERRFEAGLLDLRRRHGLYSENPHGVEITDGVLYRAVDHHPQPGAGRHLHRRNLPDRPRQGDRRGDPRHPDQQVGLRALRRARRAPPRRSSTG